MLLFWGLLLSLTRAEDELSLLQLPLFRPGSLDPASQAARLRAALPFAWVHIPKCGSSFANFIVDLPGVCPEVPRSFVISDNTGGAQQLSVFRRHFGLSNATGACESNIFRWGNHYGVGSPENWEQHYKGHAVAFFRQPEQRLISAYYYKHHSWPDKANPPASALEFAGAVQGCAVRMLTRSGNGPELSCGGGNGGLPTDSEVHLAIQRLRDFAFIGITDQWALSICLGHRVFGGSCRRSDFVDGRVTRGSENVRVRTAPEPWNTTQLHGFHDRYDGALYDAALNVFDETCKQYSATVESCQPCFEEAHVHVD